MSYILRTKISVRFMIPGLHLKMMANSKGNFSYRNATKAVMIYLRILISSCLSSELAEDIIAGGGLWLFFGGPITLQFVPAIARESISITSGTHTHTHTNTSIHS